MVNPEHFLKIFSDKFLFAQAPEIQLCGYCIVLLYWTVVSDP